MTPSPNLHKIHLHALVVDAEGERNTIVGETDSV